ncbi:hypothetical protein EQH57_0815 [Dictyocoela roeselum]|nr:hypothetical protein EQH57_0815 [Dictyocoela roeselum]
MSAGTTMVGLLCAGTVEGAAMQYNTVSWNNPIGATLCRHGCGRCYAIRHCSSRVEQLWRRYISAGMVEGAALHVVLSPALGTSFVPYNPKTYGTKYNKKIK